MKYVIFACLVAAVLAAENGTIIFPPQPPNPSNQTTASPPTTTPPNTTPPPTTTPIPTPTPAPTTRAPPITTPTPTPAPTTPVPPPTPLPGPFPPANPDNPSTGLWAKHFGDTNSSCIILKAAIQVEFPYKNKTENLKGLVNVPLNATVKGDCDEDNRTLTLEWFYKNNNTANKIKNSLIIEFQEIKDKYEVQLIKVNIYPNITFDGYNGTEMIVLIYNHTNFQTSASKSYKCDKEQTLNLTQTTNATVGFLHVWHTQFQAFQNFSSQQFESADDCEPISTSDVVPLAVGCALAGLVIIVLVAYLIGRKRVQARGYLSM